LIPKGILTLNDCGEWFSRSFLNSFVSLQGSEGDLYRDVKHFLCFKMGLVLEVFL